MTLLATTSPSSPSLISLISKDNGNEIVTGSDGLLFAPSIRKVNTLINPFNQPLATKISVDLDGITFSLTNNVNTLLYTPIVTNNTGETLHFDFVRDNIYGTGFYESQVGTNIQTANGSVLQLDAGSNDLNYGNNTSKTKIQIINRTTGNYYIMNGIITGGTTTNTNAILILTLEKIV